MSFHNSLKLVFVFYRLSRNAKYSKRTKLAGFSEGKIPHRFHHNIF